MRLLGGTRIGQSRSELTAAVIFSSFVHLVVLFGAVFLSFQVKHRISVPPAYRVKLVDLPAEMAPPAPAKPSPAIEQKPAEKKSPPKAPPARPRPAPEVARKDAMPELKEEKPRKEQIAEESAAPKPVDSGKKQEAVVVASASGTRDPKFDSYLPRVFVKLEQNWNPPPGVKGAKAKVLFTILRSGRVGDFKLLESSGNFYFDQAAMRTILASSPFPPLPEGFFKDSESFIADLMEKE